MAPRNTATHFALSMAASPGSRRSHTQRLIFPFFKRNQHDWRRNHPHVNYDATRWRFDYRNGFGILKKVRVKAIIHEFTSTIQLREWSIRSVLFTSGLIYRDQDIPRTRVWNAGTPNSSLRSNQEVKLRCTFLSTPTKRWGKYSDGSHLKILREPRSKLLASLTPRCHNAVPCKSATSIKSFMLSNNH